jgi:hypothetical protein
MEDLHTSGLHMRYFSYSYTVVRTHVVVYHVETSMDLNKLSIYTYLNDNCGTTRN